MFKKKNVFSRNDVLNINPPEVQTTFYFFTQIKKTYFEE